MQVFELCTLTTNLFKRILHPSSGRFLEVYSNHPGLQVYTGNQLPHPERIYPPNLKNCDWIDGESTKLDSLKLVNAKVNFGIVREQYNF